MKLELFAPTERYLEGPTLYIYITLYNLYIPSLWWGLVASSDFFLAGPVFGIRVGHQRWRCGAVATGSAVADGHRWAGVTGLTGGPPGAHRVDGQYKAMRSGSSLCYIYYGI